MKKDIMATGQAAGRAAEVFWAFLRLGCTSFGGPIAHFGYFHEEFVQRRKWFSEAQFTSWLALCQFLPGPASSQLGLLLGHARAGYAGAVLAWLGFTLPSALLMCALALGMGGYFAVPTSAVTLLKLLAVAVVAHALLGMLRSLGRSFAAWALMAATCTLALWLPNVWVQLVWLLVCAALGHWLFRGKETATRAEAVPVPQAWAWHRAVLWPGLLFVALLLTLPWLRHASSDAPLWMLADIFYRTGALVFGGGHTVLPWLQWELVHTGQMSAQDFLAGYSLAQAVPGPLFTFAAFLGALMQGSAGAVVALLCIFLPGTLLVFAVLPVWNHLQQNAGARAAFAGVNAAVIGLLAAAFYQPIWVSSIQSPLAFLVAALGFVALSLWKVPAWALVLMFAAAGLVLHLTPWSMG